MESDEIDIKPIIPTSCTPEKCSLSVPGSGKLKQSRYEDVWPEDVHAAFMEAVALYPPMGKRRLKYYRVSTHGNDHFSDANQTKSFGRCQLIQSYILEKTGKNRSRKQVSSHLQRLKKIHKDNPAMRPLFSERSQPPPEHCSSAPQAIAITSQDIFANISFSTRHLKSDFDLTVNLQNTDSSADNNASTSPYVSQASSFNGASYNAFDLSTNFYNQPPFFSPQEFLPPQQCLAGTLHSSDSNHLSEIQDPLLFTDAINGIRASPAFTTSAFSISMRRLASKLPTHGRPVDSGPTQFSRVPHSSGFQPTPQWVSHDGLTDSPSCHSPLAPAEQTFHTMTPSHHLQMMPQEKHRLDPGLACDWMWPQTPDIPLGPRGESFGEIHLHYPMAMYQYNPAYPITNSPGSHGSPFESDTLRLPKGISCSYAVTTPGATMLAESGLKACTGDFHGQAVSELSENYASPHVIRPTPVYPISYLHSTEIRTDEHTPTPSP